MSEQRADRGSRLATADAAEVQRRGAPESVAMLTPLPPARTGVAHYASMLLPALGGRITVRAFRSADDYRRADFDEVIYQLGNNPHHEWIYEEAMREPGIAVLHDLVLHHLIVESTLARGDAAAYVAALEASHGAAGAAWARGRAAGLHTELGNFLLPASVDVARRSRAVIVHNSYAAERLRSFGVTVPIHVVPHPYLREEELVDRQVIRKKLGFADAERVIGLFGFLTTAKRAEVVIEAFGRARERNGGLKLLIVGEPAPNIDLAQLSGEGVLITGYVPDDEFPLYYAAADRFVNLRYPTAGETSGTLIRALDAGKPVAVSDYAQFAELPDDCVFKVPLGEGETDRLVEFFLADIADPAAAQRRWLEQNARIELAVEGYLRALSGRPVDVASRAVRSSLPLFPDLELVDARLDGCVRLTLRNRGPETIRTRTYGQPEYRLIVKLFAAGVQVQDRWLELPRDLAPGEVAELEFPLHVAADEVEARLYHAMQDVPAVDARAWVAVRLTHVR
jgi:glycosyltransferase involved in cell wall biosynthesis